MATGDDPRRTFIGEEKLLDKFRDQLQTFREWTDKRDWLAFHHHHYDWWMFPIDEISSREHEFQLTPEAIGKLRRDRQFIEELREGVRLMVRSWAWDIDQAKLIEGADDKQKWSSWPVRLYKAGKSMLIFGQTDYYQSLRVFAHYLRHDKNEKLDFFSHTTGTKADVLERWNAAERQYPPVNK